MDTITCRPALVLHNAGQANLVLWCFGVVVRYQQTLLQNTDGTYTANRCSLHTKNHSNSYPRMVTPHVTN